MGAAIASLLIVTIGKSGYSLFFVLMIGYCVVIDCMCQYRLARCFGKDAVFGYAMFIINPIMMPVLAFFSERYDGPWINGKPAKGLLRRSFTVTSLTKKSKNKRETTEKTPKKKK